MSTDAILSAIQASPLSHWIAEADHLFTAGLQVIHIIGFILLLSSLLLMSLRLLRLVFVGQSATQVAAGMNRLLWLGLALAVATGLVMFVGAPKHYFYNPAFACKMVLLAAAVLVQSAIFNRIALRPDVSPTAIRFIVGLSLAAWFGVSLAGRSIGFV
jgi:hypothetical protein